MAGRGPAPKMPEDRVSMKVPERGDWQTLPPLAKPVLPALPKDQDWSPRTKRAWKAWRSSWVTQVYGPDEIAMAVELAYLFEAMTESMDYKTAGEVRQWMDRLGLTLKGKRDLRLRTVAPETAPTSDQQDDDFEGLRLVDGTG